MNKKKILLITLIIILLLIVVYITGFFIFHKGENNKDNYKLIYYDDYEPGSKNEITITNTKVIISTTSLCTAKECPSNNKKDKTYKYSKENMTKLLTFIKNNFKNVGKKTITLEQKDLSDYQNEVIRGLLTSEYFFEIAVEEYEYKLDYDENKNLGYLVYFKKDKSILVKKLKLNNNFNIIKVDTYSLNFSKKNLEILNTYIKKEAKNQKSNYINKSVLKKYETKLIKSIIENNESYLKNIEKDPKVTYVISYDGIDCDTPTLYLYSDNTYEFFDTGSVDYKPIVPKTGSYNYDISKIISSSNNYPADKVGPYIIIDYDGNGYQVYSSSLELQEFLNSLNLKLEACLKYQ